MSTSSLGFLRTPLLICLCYCLVKLTSCIDPNSNTKEKIELHHLFEGYNKPIVQEIQTIHGDTYNCVDFYKQSAFNHPMLKNQLHHVEMNHHEAISEESQLFKKLWANGEGCPTGTIPIRKYTKQEFIETNNLFQELHSTDDSVSGLYRASVSTRNGNHTFYGGSAFINIYNYPINTSQYTAGYMMVRGGDDQLQFGWMINPALYGDDKTRLFLTTKVGRKKCFNLICGGYVHTNKDIPIDIVLDNTTIRGAERGIEIKPIIIKENNTWKLYGNDKIPLGYWPNETLSDLKGPADYLEWGGEAYNPYFLKGPRMGSGFFPTGHRRKDGYARLLMKYDENGKGSYVVDNETESRTDDSKLYKVKYGGFVDNVGHIIYYGGPGETSI